MQKKIQELEVLHKQGVDYPQHTPNLLNHANGVKILLKVPHPKKYDGNQAGLKTFLAKCHLYLEYQTGRLGRDTDKNVG